MRAIDFIVSCILVPLAIALVGAWLLSVVINGRWRP